MKIKQIIRRNLPETNSSSSHSLVIDLGPERDKREGELHIQDTNFYQDPIVYSNLESKIEYAIGLSVYKENTIEGFIENRANPIKKLVAEECPECEVIFEFIDTLVKCWIEGNDEYAKESPYEFLPDIDHQSMDLYEEVWESEETLRQFLFNPKSKFYVDSDSYDLIDLIDNMDLDEADLTVVYPIGGEIGNIELKSYTVDEDSQLFRVFCHEKDEILLSIVFENGAARSRTEGDENNPDVFKYETNFMFGSTNLEGKWKNQKGEEILIKPTIISKEFGVL